jgi:hypothetical protein
MIFVLDKPREPPPISEPDSMIAVPAVVVPLDERLRFFAVLTNVFVYCHIAVIAAGLLRVVCGTQIPFECFL